MKSRLLFATLMLLTMAGCAKPDSITTVQSPTKGVFYTVETHYGDGPLRSDFTRVYAHLERNGRTDRKLVVDGTYLEFSKIVWESPHNVKLCMKAGITDSFSSQVTLIAGDASETIHNDLQQRSESQKSGCD